MRTALKMPAGEPISAYEVFKASKNRTGGNKNSKNKQNKKNSRRNNVKKPAQAKAAGKLKTVNTNRPASERTSSELINLVETVCTDGSKKRTKKEAKKQKEPTAKLQNERDTSFGSEESKEEYTSYTESNSYSDEYTIDDENGLEEEFLNSNKADDSCERSSTEPKDNKKRKSVESEQPKTKSKANAISECKKSKKLDPKTQLRYSLSSAESDTVPKQKNGRRTSLFTSHEIVKELTGTTNSNATIKPLIPPTNIVKINSIEEGKRAFQWLLNPVTIDDFFDKYWEQKACLIKRNQSSYFPHLISFESIDQMLLKNHVEFTKNIDVTSYTNGVRETLNPEGRALPPVVWDHYGQGCSIRLLNPQTFLPALFKLCTTMQEYFHCLVGTNAYLTPPNSQGFAPHYDDIEAFVLQIEGRKRWKLYKPRTASEMLPRYSSKNFTQEEIGKPILEKVLEPGDVLYFPRGTIHQASTEPGYHSLHITLSVYQKQSFADLFEKMLPIMLQKAIVANVELRKGLPLHTWQHAGIVYSDSSTKERADMTKKVTQLMHKFMHDLPLQEIMDAGVDQLAKKFQHEALPPEILPEEKLRTIFGFHSRTNERGECVCDYDIDERTNVRLLRANILRLVEEGDKICIYYYLDNSKEYCEYEPNFIEIERAEAASVEVLIKSYPQYVGVSQLPLPSDEEKIMLVSALWERGLLMMEKPFR